MNTEFSIGDVKFDFDHNDVLDVTQVKSDTHQVTLVTFDYSQSNKLKVVTWHDSRTASISLQAVIEVSAPLEYTRSVALHNEMALLQDRLLGVA